MKKIIFIFTVFLISLITSCGTQNKIVAFNDDVYANPAEDKKEQARLAAIQQQKQDAIKARYNDSVALVNTKQKALDDANPNYKERTFKYDDYYDYEYATRLKRFDNNVQGLSYYDNYYTNSYWYNKNPYNYGTSVYNGYSWWGNSYNIYSYNPSANFYYNNGWYSSYPSYGYNGYNPYNSYNNSYNNSYMQGYNNGYYNGYNNGWNNYPYYGYGNNYYGYNNYNPYGNYYGSNNNGYSNNWGYYNGYDNNSSYTYGPRSSHSGGNNQRSSSAGMTGSTDNNYYNTLVQTVNTTQTKATKFDPTIVSKSTITDRTIRVNDKGQAIDAKNDTYSRSTNDDNGLKTEKKQDVYTQPNRSYSSPNNTNDVYYNKSTPLKENPNNSTAPTKTTRDNFENKTYTTETPTKFENNTRNTDLSFPTNNNNNGGGVTPSNSGSSGRPRN